MNLKELISSPLIILLNLIISSLSFDSNEAGAAGNKSFLGMSGGI